MSAVVIDFKTRQVLEQEINFCESVKSLVNTEQTDWKPAYCDPENVVTGQKYEQVKNLDIKDVAKLIRKDLKEKFKGYKFSVRISRFSMGQSLDVYVKETPENFKKYKDEKDETYNCYVYTDEATKLLEAVESVVKQYNQTNIDSQSDYFDVSFYSHVSFD